MKKLITKISVLIFLCALNLKADSSIYTVKDNQIFLQNDNNVLELRNIAKQMAFQNAFKIITKKILGQKELITLDQINDIDISKLIKDYKIIEEKITDINYSANISVNFNSESLLNFLEQNRIKSKVMVSEEYLLFPIYDKFNTFYLWEKDNDWYESLLNEYDELGLLKLFFPKRNHINKLRISSERLLAEDINSISKFLDLYKKKKAIIILLSENYDLDSNLIKSKVSAKLFANGEFTEINLFEKTDFEENSNESNAKLISKVVMNELQNWWKNQIDSINFQSDNKNTFFLKLNAFDLKKNIFIENKIKDIVGKDQFFFHEFDNKNIIYKFQTSYDINQLNLALEIDNLKLLKPNSESKYFLLQSF